jgi:hypothetical protein
MHSRGAVGVEKIAGCWRGMLAQWAEKYEFACDPKIRSLTNVLRREPHAPGEVRYAIADGVFGRFQL